MRVGCVGFFEKCQADPAGEELGLGETRAFGQIMRGDYPLRFRIVAIDKRLPHQN